MVKIDEMINTIRQALGDRGLSVHRIEIEAIDQTTGYTVSIVLTGPTGITYSGGWSSENVTYKVS